eukprot:evm.model.scf_1629.1 EVM.evm.TU.scf_1629.1   scf_1629:2772-10587(+)
MGQGTVKVKQRKLGKGKMSLVMKGRKAVDTMPEKVDTAGCESQGGVQMLDSAKVPRNADSADESVSEKTNAASEGGPNEMPYGDAHQPAVVCAKIALQPVQPGGSGAKKTAVRAEARTSVAIDRTSEAAAQQSVSGEESIAGAVAEERSLLAMASTASKATDGKEGPVASQPAKQSRIAAPAGGKSKAGISPDASRAIAAPKDAAAGTTQKAKSSRKKPEVKAAAKLAAVNKESALPKMPKLKAPRSKGSGVAKPKEPEPAAAGSALKGSVIPRSPGPVKAKGDTVEVAKTKDRSVASVGPTPKDTVIPKTPEPTKELTSHPVAVSSADAVEAQAVTAVKPVQKQSSIPKLAGVGRRPESTADAEDTGAATAKAEVHAPVAAALSPKGSVIPKTPKAPKGSKTQMESSVKASEKKTRPAATAGAAGSTGIPKASSTPKTATAERDAFADGVKKEAEAVAAPVVANKEALVCKGAEAPVQTTQHAVGGATDESEPPKQAKPMKPVAPGASMSKESVIPKLPKAPTTLAYQEPASEGRTERSADRVSATAAASKDGVALKAAETHEVMKAKDVLSAAGTPEGTSAVSKAVKSPKIAVARKSVSAGQAVKNEAAAASKENGISEVLKAPKVAKAEKPAAANETGGEVAAGSVSAVPGKGSIIPKSPKVVMPRKPVAACQAEKVPAVVATAAIAKGESIIPKSPRVMKSMPREGASAIPKVAESPRMPKAQKLSGAGQVEKKCGAVVAPKGRPTPKVDASSGVVNVQKPVAAVLPDKEVVGSSSAASANKSSIPKLSEGRQAPESQEPSVSSSEGGTAATSQEAEQPALAVSQEVAVPNRTEARTEPAVSDEASTNPKVAETPAPAKTQGNAVSGGAECKELATTTVASKNKVVPRAAGAPKVAKVQKAGAEGGDERKGQAMASADSSIKEAVSTKRANVAQAVEAVKGKVPAVGDAALTTGAKVPKEVVSCTPRKERAARKESSIPRSPKVVKEVAAEATTAGSAAQKKQSAAVPARASQVKDANPRDPAPAKEQVGKESPGAHAEGGRGEPLVATGVAKEGSASKRSSAGKTPASHKAEAPSNAERKPATAVRGEKSSAQKAVEVTKGLKEAREKMGKKAEVPTVAVVQEKIVIPTTCDSAKELQARELKAEGTVKEELATSMVEQTLENAVPSPAEVVTAEVVVPAATIGANATAQKESPSQGSGADRKSQSSLEESSMLVEIPQKDRVTPKSGESSPAAGSPGLQGKDYRPARAETCVSVDVPRTLAETDAAASKTSAAHAQECVAPPSIEGHTGVSAELQVGTAGAAAGTDGQDLVRASVECADSARKLQSAQVNPPSSACEGTEETGPSQLEDSIAPSPAQGESTAVEEAKPPAKPVASHPVADEVVMVEPAPSEAQDGGSEAGCATVGEPVVSDKEATALPDHSVATSQPAESCVTSASAAPCEAAPKGEMELREPVSSCDAHKTAVPNPEGATAVMASIPAKLATGSSVAETKVSESVTATDVASAAQGCSVGLRQPSKEAANSAESGQGDGTAASKRDSQVEPHTASSESVEKPSAKECDSGSTAARASDGAASSEDEEWLKEQTAAVLEKLDARTSAPQVRRGVGRRMLPGMWDERKSPEVPSRDYSARRATNSIRGGRTARAPSRPAFDSRPVRKPGLFNPCDDDIPGSRRRLAALDVEPTRHTRASVHSAASVRPAVPHSGSVSMRTTSARTASTHSVPARTVSRAAKTSVPVPSVPKSVPARTRAHAPTASAPKSVPARTSLHAATKAAAPGVSRTAAARATGTRSAGGAVSRATPVRTPATRPAASMPRRESLIPKSSKIPHLASIPKDVTEGASSGQAGDGMDDTANVRQLPSPVAQALKRQSTPGVQSPEVRPRSTKPTKASSAREPASVRGLLRRDTSPSVATLARRPSTRTEPKPAKSTRSTPPAPEFSRSVPRCAQISSKSPLPPAARPKSRTSTLSQLQTAAGRVRKVAAAAAAQPSPAFRPPTVRPKKIEDQREVQERRRAAQRPRVSTSSSGWQPPAPPKISRRPTQPAKPAKLAPKALGTTTEEIYYRQVKDAEAAKKRQGHVKATSTTRTSTVERSHSQVTRTVVETYERKQGNKVIREEKITRVSTPTRVSVPQYMKRTVAHSPKLASAARAHHWKEVIDPKKQEKMEALRRKREDKMAKELEARDRVIRWTRESIVYKSSPMPLFGDQYPEDGTCAAAQNEGHQDSHEDSHQATPPVECPALGSDAVQVPSPEVVV